MPSRILHLAVTQKLLAALPFRDPQMLRIGSVLPDAEIPGGGFPPKRTAHFQKTFDDGAKKTLDLTGFRAAYADLLPADEFTLGYYLHLAGDVVHRQMFHNERGLYLSDREEVQKVHRDYAMLNPYIIEAYGLRPEEALPSPETLAGLSDHPLMKAFSFDYAGFFTAMAEDFLPPSSPHSEDDFRIFTPAFAEEWIGRTARALTREVVSLRQTGASVLDEEAMGWERRW